MTPAEMMFHAEVSVRYHRRRAAFLERASSLMSVIILLGGAAAFVGLVGEATLFAKIITLAIVVVGVVQIVFQTDRCAAAHRLWLRQWSELLADVKKAHDADQSTVDGWIDRQIAIESDCVGEMRALANDSYNRTMNALDRDGHPFKITPWQRFWMQIFSFENAEYR